MKSAEEIMEAYHLTGSFRDAAELDRVFVLVSSTLPELAEDLQAVPEAITPCAGRRSCSSKERGCTRHLRFIVPTWSRARVPDRSVH